MESLKLLAVNCTTGRLTTSSSSSSYTSTLSSSEARTDGDKRNRRSRAMVDNSTVKGRPFGIVGRFSVVTALVVVDCLFFPLAPASPSVVRTDDSSVGC